jgi:hypothetical protein
LFRQEVAELQNAGGPPIGRGDALRSWLFKFGVAEAIADDMRVSISCGACSEVRPIPLAEIPQTGKTYDHDCAAGQALALRGMHLFAALSESAGSASGSIEEQLMSALGGKRTILGKALTDHLVHVMAGAEIEFCEDHPWPLLTMTQFSASSPKKAVSHWNYLQAKPG